MGLLENLNSHMWPSFVAHIIFLLDNTVLEGPGGAYKAPVGI